MNNKSKGIALVLTFFFGCWGAHKFYLGDTKKGFIYLVLGFIGLFTWLPLFITGILSLIDFFKLIFMSDEEFNSEFCSATHNVTVQPEFTPTSRIISDVETTDVEEVVAENDNQNDKAGFTFCTDCGAKVAVGSKFCTSCGKPM